MVTCTEVAILCVYVCVYTQYKCQVSCQKLTLFILADDVSLPHTFVQASTEAEKQRVSGKSGVKQQEAQTIRSRERKRCQTKLLLLTVHFHEDHMVKY